MHPDRVAALADHPSIRLKTFAVPWPARICVLLIAVLASLAVSNGRVAWAQEQDGTPAETSLEGTSQAADVATRQLIRGAARGRVRSVVAALEAGARIDEARPEFVGASGQTPLVSASLRGYDRVVRVLLEHGADPTIAEKDGFTVWHAAAFQGRTDVLIVLDEFEVPGYGLSPKDGFTPLHRAAWGRTLRHVRAVEYLIGPSGRPCDSASADGKTPLDVAKHPLIRKLLEACLAKSAQTQASDSSAGDPVKGRQEAPPP